MSGRFGDALPTRVICGSVPSPWGMLKVVLEPSPVNFIVPPFLWSGALLSRSLRAATMLFHSSGVSISTPL